MSAPVAVNTADGTCWTRRGETRGGEALYAPEGVCSCPEFVMATLAELAEHGIVGSADALPMPAGPEADDRAKAPWGRGEDGRPLLPMGAHWTDVPEVVDRWVAKIQARVDEAKPGPWYRAPATELGVTPGTVRTHIDGYPRMVGQFTNLSPADLEMVLYAGSDLRWCLEMIAKFRTQAAELEGRLRVAEDRRVRALGENDALRKQLGDAGRERDTLRERVAELEAAQRPADGSSYPPALPWAKLMDHEDLTDFLDELAASAITHADSETALTEVEDTCSRWRAIAEAQHAHNTAPGPDAETKTAADVTTASKHTADLVTLAPAQHADATYDATFQTISLELTATRTQWSAWQKALKVDLARTTNRGSCTTSHATWRGIHVVIRCYVVQGGGE